MPPVLAVSALLRARDGRVLLVRRAKAPYAGCWSLPGGRVDPGETLAAAAARELLEETRVRVASQPTCVARLAIGSFDLHVLDFGIADPLPRPVAASDALDARFVAPETLGEDEVTPGLLEILTRR